MCDDPKNGCGSAPKLPASESVHSDRENKKTPELQLATAEDISNLYRTLLGRRPDPEGVKAIGQPLVKIAIEFALSPEYRQRIRGADARDIESLYQELLGCTAPEATVRAQIGKPIIDVALAIMRSDRFKEKLRLPSREELEFLYQKILSRAPEENVISAPNMPLHKLAAEMALSEEYKRRVRIAGRSDILQIWQLMFPYEHLDESWLNEYERIMHVHNLSIMSAVRQCFFMFEKRRTGLLSPEILHMAGWPEINVSGQKEYSKLRDDVVMVIPTFNSEKWVRPFLNFYKLHGVDPIYAVDSRTSDQTRSLIAQHGFRTIVVDGSDARVEALLPSIASKLDVPWLLRIDDDELPTPQVFNYINSLSSTIESPIGFARSHLRYDKDAKRLQRSHFIAYGPDANMDLQWRMFRPRAVRFDSRLHSPGYLLESGIIAPRRAQILHFDWVIRNEAERKEKLRRYEKQSQAQAKKYRHLTVYETVPTDWHIFSDVNDQALTALAEELAAC